jgi:hypothetical protein
MPPGETRPEDGPGGDKIASLHSLALGGRGDTLAGESPYQITGPLTPLEMEGGDMPDLRSTAFTRATSSVGRKGFVI